jgi:hypothetical protein
VSLFGIFLTPVFFSVVRWFTDRKEVKPALAHGPDAAPARTILAGLAGSAPRAFPARNGDARYASVEPSWRGTLDRHQ